MRARLHTVLALAAILSAGCGGKTNPAVPDRPDIPKRPTPEWTEDAYYDWTAVDTHSPCPGVTYTKYSFDNIPLIMNVLELDLANPSLELTTAFANNCVPNPNGNGNSNNGFNLRETLSQLCSRKRTEGEGIVAGVNSGFFDSNDGIPRGFHVENGRPVFINNPDVVKRLTNHAWAFTVFIDGTASCGRKSFSGKLLAKGKEFDYLSVNDTILRHTSSKHQINLFDRHYVEKPHPERPELANTLANNALYLIAEYSGNAMTVNGGFAAARITAIKDGRSTPLATLPYISSDKQVGIALSGAQAKAVGGLVSVGDEISLRCDISVEGEATRPILTQNSSMFLIMKEGEDNTSSIPATNTVLSEAAPLTFPVVSKDGRTVWLVQVDGRSKVSSGVRAYEMFRIAKKLGGWSMTRFDGGGSSSMWVYRASDDSGSLVSEPSDSKGERSCMNYLLVRQKM